MLNYWIKVIPSFEPVMKCWFYQQWWHTVLDVAKTLICLSIIICGSVLYFQLTNSTLWAPASREGFKELCKKELRQNNTFSESKDGKSMIEHINNIMCPNECSGNGVCTNGKQKLKHIYENFICLLKHMKNKENQ